MFHKDKDLSTMEEMRKNTSPLDAPIESQPLDAEALIERLGELKQYKANSNLPTVRTKSEKEVNTSRECPAKTNSFELIERPKNLEQEETKECKVLVRTQACEFSVSQGNFELLKPNTSMSSVRSLESTSTDDSGLCFAIDQLNLNILNIEPIRLFNFPSASTDDYSDADSGSLDFSSSPGVLSLNEETFIREINKHDNGISENSYTARNFNPSSQITGDVEFGVARLEYISAPQAVKIVRLKNASRTVAENKLETENPKTDGKKKTDSPKVSFKIPEGKATTSKSVLPSNRSPYSGRKTPSTPRSPHKRKNHPSESSSIASGSTSIVAREFFKFTCLLTAAAIEVFLLLTIIYFIPKHTILGALAMAGLSILMVFTFVCLLVVFKMGGTQLQQPTFV